MGNYLLPTFSQCFVKKDTFNKINNYNDNESDEGPGFDFYVYLASYNMENKQIGKIRLFKANSNTKVMNFIESIFQPHEWKIVHLYNAIDSLEIDKYIKFYNVLHIHSALQFLYVFEDDIYYKYKNKKIRYFGYLELRNIYIKYGNYDDCITISNNSLKPNKNIENNNSNLIKLMLKNIKDIKSLTKEFSADKSDKVEKFIKDKFNPPVILFYKGNIINEEKTFEENNFNGSEKEYQIFYLEKNRDNFSENGYIIHNYLLIEKIGSGGFGKVYKAIDIKSLKECAIKEIEFTSDMTNQIENENFLLSNLRHKYIVRYYQSFKEKNYFYIVMELCSKNNIFDLTRDMSKQHQKLNENFIWELFLKICIGVGYFHKEDVIHRDLKASNIFISEDGNPKIGDFGISKILESQFAKSIHETSFYASPELWNYQEYNDKVDSWGIGCILYELCKLDYPFIEENIIALKDKICRGDYPPIPDNYSQNMNKAIKQLLEVDQTKRLSIKNFLIQNYIQDIAESVALLPELHQLYPLKVKSPGDNIIHHVYKNILRRNGVLKESLFNNNFDKNPEDWKKEKEKITSYSLDYYPPFGWVGIGLNIDKYNDGNDWLDKEKGWATAYHGLRLCITKDKKYINFNCHEFDYNMKLELTIKSIMENGLKDGINQPFQFEKNTFSLSKDEYELCGEGIYLAFQIEEAKKYTKAISGYDFILMCKVHPKKIRESGRFQGEFVADGNYIRPYRILAKKNNN